MVDIYREQTDSEKVLSKGGFINIKKKFVDFERLALLELDKIAFEYLNKKKKPFSRQLAIREIEDKVKELKNKMQDGFEFPDGKVNLNINFDKFADPNLFEFLGESVVTEVKFYDGMKQPVEVGKDMQYIRKNSQEKICIFIDHYDQKNLDKNDFQTKDKSKKD